MKSALIISLILILNYSAIKAQTFQSGDVFVATVYNSPTPGVNWFSPNGTLISNFFSYPFYEYSYALAFDKFGYLYVADNWFGSNIAKIDSQGNYIGDFLTGLERPIQIVFDSSGNVFVGFNLDGNTGGIIKYDQNGNFIHHYTEAELGIVFGIDLDKNQCIIYYVNGNDPVVRRWDVCSNTPLPDFATAPFGEACTTIKLRSNGEVFVSQANPLNGKILRLDRFGRLLQYYIFEWSHAISFDPDQTSFWVANAYSNDIVRFEIETGAILTSFISTSGISSFDVIVKDEILAATSRQPAIPDSTSLSLNPTDTLNQINIPLYFEIPIRNNHGVVCKFNYLDIERHGVNGHAIDSSASGQLGNAYYYYTGQNPGKDTVIGTLRSNGYKDTVIITWDQVISVEPSSSAFPEQYNLSQNYPNPFNPVTHLEFGIPDLGFVTLKVYDVLGSEVKTLVNENKPAGLYEVEFDGSNLSSGNYFYKLEAGNFSKTMKMVILK